MHRRLATHFALTSSLLSLTVGCESIIGADFSGARLRPARLRDASTDANSAEAMPPCNPLVPVERQPDMAHATDTVEFTVVVRTVDYGDDAPDAGSPAYASRGYDLDDTCTAGLRTSSCTPRSWIGSVTADGPRGQDNAVGGLLAAQAGVFGRQVVGSNFLNAAVARGEDAPVGVLRIRGFGGLSEDDRVEVDWFVAAPPLVTPDGGTRPATVPAFDAGDQWPILSPSVADPTVATAAATVSLYRDPTAFVTRNQLVAHFSTLIFPISNVYFTVTDAVLTGEIERDPVSGIWMLINASFAGHGRTDDLLGVIPEIVQTLFGSSVHLCTDDQANYSQVKRYICGSADVPATRGARPDSACVGSSVGASLVTAPATLGAIVEPVPRPELCPPATAPKNDTCATPPGGGG